MTHRAITKMTTQPNHEMWTTVCPRRVCRAVLRRDAITSPES
jgi:hypothetical protein